ncbi:MAG: hypothetical protein HY369_02355 [Candidatus Aenigmarchaeota archaeon]|nr:hypothetical protein [Candidatus Aenigmarchaeota archaeon]
MPFLLDTNFLLIPAQFRVDVYDQLLGFGAPRFYTVSLVVQELEKLAEKGVAGKHARLALLQLRQQGVRVIPVEGRSADAALLKLADRFTVCTQDRELIRRIHARRLQVITMRQRKTLAML